MINKLRYVISNQFDPIYNLSLENYLLDRVEEGELILYLWQNERTIVIGRNQNPYKECKIGELEKDGGCFVRRLSGGGAVFHDTGNLNFTFLTKKSTYDLEKQLDVIIKAVQSYDIKAEKSGRNDITVENKKISGNAFYEKDGACYHHGTILVQVDKEKLSYYLNVSKDKLLGKGVDSVKSRVANLTDFKESITIESVKERLLEACSVVYKKEVLPYEKEIDKDILVEYQIRFSSREWRYGKSLECSYKVSKRFSFGEVEIILSIEGDDIKDCVVYTDALDISISHNVENILKQCEFNSIDIRNRYYESLAGEEEPSFMRIDILEYLIEEVESDGL